MSDPPKTSAVKFPENDVAVPGVDVQNRTATAQLSLRANVALSRGMAAALG